MHRTNEVFTELLTKGKTKMTIYKYMDDRIGFFSYPDDDAYVMDDFGVLVEVPWTLETFYWQEH